MESRWLFGFRKLFVACVFFMYCDGATVQFFNRYHFQGEIYQTNSSSTCQSIPSSITGGFSVKTTGCIAVFENGDCSGGYYVVRQESRGLIKPGRFYRDCNDLEKGPQVNLDYYPNTNRSEENVVEYRDICTCTNLPSSNYSWQALNTYGNHFTFYEDVNCQGIESEIAGPQRYASWTISSDQSFLPLEIPSHCSQRFNLTAEILNFELVSDINSKKNVEREVNVAPKQIFVNNSSKPIEHIYDKRFTSNSAEMLLSTAFHQMSSIKIKNTTDISILTNYSLSSIKSLEEQLRNDLVSTLHSHSQSKSSEAIKVSATQLNKAVILPPCTEGKVTSFRNALENFEGDFNIQVRLTGQMGSQNLTLVDIQRNLHGFTYLNSTNVNTVIAETTGKLKMIYGGEPQFNVTVTPIPECRSRFLTLTANIFNIEPITNSSNFQDYTHQVPATDKEIYINNGTVPQEYNFETTKQISQTGQFVFPDEINRINSISIEHNFESSIPILTTAWGDLKNGMADIYKSRQNMNEPFIYITSSNKTYQLRRIINVPACQKYEVNSFVEVAKDVEMEYRVQLRVTGKLGDEVVGVDEVQDNLKGLTFLASGDTRTAVAETTIKLKLTFGVSSGVNVEGNHMIDCLEAQAAFIRNCKFVCSGGI